MAGRSRLEQFFDQVLVQAAKFEELPNDELEKLLADASAEVTRLELLADAIPGGNADRWAAEEARIRAAAIAFAMLDWETPWYGPFPPEIGNRGNEKVVE